MSTRTFATLGLSTVALFAAVAACSSSSSTGTYDPGTGTGTDAGSGSKVDSGSAAAKDAGSGTQGKDSGGGTGTDAGSGGDGGVYDFGCGGNTACPLTDECCAKPGTPTTFSCVPLGTCSAGDKIICDGPDECGGTTPICCGVETTGAGGSYPSCNASGLSTTCTSLAACPTHLGTSCTDTTKINICHSAAADCLDPSNPKCCTFNSNGATLTFCTDTLTSLGATSCAP